MMSNKRFGFWILGSVVILPITVLSVMGRINQPRSTPDLTPGSNRAARAYQSEQASIIVSAAQKNPEVHWNQEAIEGAQYARATARAFIRKHLEIMPDEKSSGIFKTVARLTFPQGPDEVQLVGPRQYILKGHVDRDVGLEALKRVKWSCIVRWRGPALEDYDVEAVSVSK